MAAPSLFSSTPDCGHSGDWAFAVLDLIAQHRRRIVGNACEENHERGQATLTLSSWALIARDMQFMEAFITGTCFHTQGWTGSQGNQVLHFYNMVAQCSEISPQDFTDEQKVMFLKNAVARTPHLALIYETLKASRQGISPTSGCTTIPVKFDEL